MNLKFNSRFYIVIIVFTLFSCSGLRTQTAKTTIHNNQINNKDSISLIYKEKSLIKPFQKLNSLDSLFNYYESYYPYSKEFKKYNDTSRYAMYVLEYDDLTNLYNRSEGAIGGDIFLSVEKSSMNIVGVEGRWAFYVNDLDSITAQMVSNIQETFFPTLPVDISIDTNWFYQLESENYTEYIEFLGSEKVDSSYTILPVIHYVVEF